MTVRRDWSEARQKVEAEGKCRRCYRSDVRLEAAHVIGRAKDKPRVEGSTSRVLFVHPLSIVPLCGDRIEGDRSVQGCHSLYDRGEITILPFLTLEEQLRAVEDARSIEAARRRLDAPDYRDEIREARAKAKEAR